MTFFIKMDYLSMTCMHVSTYVILQVVGLSFIRYFMYLLEVSKEYLLSISLETFGDGSSAKCFGTK